MNYRNAALSVVGALAALSLVGCASTTIATKSGSDPKTIAVVASTDVWGSIASSVGGKYVSVTSIIDKPDQDPHEYEADAQTQLSLSKAEVVVENGGGYDDFVGRMLKATANREAEVINAVEISGKRAAAGEELNEHVWYDFPTVEKVIDRITSEYTALAPSHSSAFTKNAASLKAKIESLEQKEEAIKARHSGENVSITEPVPLYMLQAMGLVNRTPTAFSSAIEEDTDVAPLLLQQTLSLYTTHTVRLLAYNEQTTGPQTEAVLKAAKKNSIPVVPVTETLPAGTTYTSWMSANVNAIGEALDK
ncbi:zinc ABC transporter substrate-binding protein [soil metagenome]